ncbi:shikimate dehydrogenase [Ruegeria sp. WL0004]|uniref:Shikimate dehydrogenase n=1 Tax=Ruegeria marisflavi TaxID=2984152 RepID=A0ABT2X277_9RHOB|nr:shikimate dehydrogenase [Ruegeria sp. WL0004]MCU9840193.1 shikimate dehydrogenase [Ruegeria sp. WL0004]
MTALRCGLIGAGLSRSRFGAALALLGQEYGLTVDYTLIDTEGLPDFDLPTALSRCRDTGWSGVSVTHPFKPEAALWAGEAMRSEVARLGACNLLTFSPDFSGHNTDFTGFLGAWRNRFGTRSPGRVAMAGAGGVAGALGGALIALGAEDIALWDPVPGRAAALAKLLDPPARAVAMNAAEHTARGAHGLVNATALGMGTDTRSAFAPSWIGKQEWAFDAVYTPVETPFLQNAATSGLICLTGFDLFRFMAIGSFAALSGHATDPALAALLDPLRPKEIA